MNVGSAKLSSPVYDNTSGNVPFGDFGGVLHSVTSAGVVHGTTGTAIPLGDAIADAPLVDGSEGIQFLFVNMSGTYSETNYDAVYEYSTGFTTFGCSGGCCGVLCGHERGTLPFSGTFDNVYYQSSVGTGDIYVVSNTGLRRGQVCGGYP